jgi:hypothetical protein
MFVAHSPLVQRLIADDYVSKDYASNLGTDSLLLGVPKYSPNSRNIVKLAQKLEEKRLACSEY